MLIFYLFFEKPDGSYQVDMLCLLKVCYVLYNCAFLIFVLQLTISAFFLYAWMVLLLYIVLFDWNLFSLNMIFDKHFSWLLLSTKNISNLTRIWKNSGVFEFRFELAASYGLSDSSNSDSQKHVNPYFDSEFQFLPWFYIVAVKLI